MQKTAIGHIALTAAISAFALAGITTPALAQQNGGRNAPITVPISIEAISSQANRTGSATTLNAIGPTSTGSNAFFQTLGTNQRTCFTCHQPQSGWSVSPGDISRRFNDSQGQDPIFRPVDGATCPNADVSTPTARLTAYNLLLDKGLIRVGETLPDTGLQFSFGRINDPYNCTSSAKFGLTSPTTGDVSVYRRILPSTNLRFAGALMWDGRYPTLSKQAGDATLDHAEAHAIPTDLQVQSMVDFESALTTAQSADNQAGPLNILGALGGPASLAQVPFYPGINDSLGRDPKGARFNPNVFTIYAAWNRAPLTADPAEARRNAIGRGERLFNQRQFTINNVGGLTDGLPGNQLRGTCSTCHDTPNAGNRSLPDFLDIGLAGPNPPGLDVGYLPQFRLECTSGPLAGRQIVTTDPGRALATGNCADISRFKVPSLRGLAARAPYFHNGAADNLGQVVGFYDRRFRIGLNPQDRDDLTAFLEAL